MSLSIDLTPHLESRLNEEAARAGVPPEHLVVSALSRYLQVEPNVASATDEELVEFIGGGMSAGDWTRYYELVARRQAEQIAAEELAELQRMTERVEELNAVRLKCLAELAKRRATSIEVQMRKLGIEPPEVL